MKTQELYVSLINEKLTITNQTTIETDEITSVLYSPETDKIIIFIDKSLYPIEISRNLFSGEALIMIDKMANHRNSKHWYIIYTKADGSHGETPMLNIEDAASIWGVVKRHDMSGVLMRYNGENHEQVRRFTNPELLANWRKSKGLNPNDYPPIPDEEIAEWKYKS